MIRLALNLAVAALLAWLLLATAPASGPASLVVVARGATPAQIAAIDRDALVVRLPEAPDAPGAEAVPDLAAALRRHPDPRELRVVGDGLAPRDRDALHGARFAFDAAPEREGFASLETPAAAYAGGVARIAGRAVAPTGSRAELRDPSGAIAASEPLGDDGRFVLDAPLRAPGRATFRARVIAPGDRVVDDETVPLEARAGERVRVILLAGAPGPETRALKRWIADAGLELDERTALTEGVALRSGRARVDDAALAETDLVIVDERAWAALTRAEKDAIARALREGLGVLLRATGPLPPAVRDDWKALGLELVDADLSAQAPVERALGASGPGLELARRALRVAGADAAPLLVADDAAPLGAWRAVGRGRAGAWWLDDSFRLALAGRAERHGALWSRLATTLARARGDAWPTAPRGARVGRRALLCAIDPTTKLIDPDGAEVALLVDATSGCAPLWPRTAGWHTIARGARRVGFHVSASDEAPTLLAADDRAATTALAAATSRSASARAASPWRAPLFLSWLAASATLWWLERRTRGI